jgi:hypothetical protein
VTEEQPTGSHNERVCLRAGHGRKGLGELVGTPHLKSSTWQI